MKKLTFLLFLICFCKTNAQKSIIQSTITNQVRLNADDFFGEDNLGYYYFSKDNTLIKVKDNEKYQYKNVALGKIKKIDFQNPLRLLLFYEDFNTIIALDSQCNELQKLFLSETPFLITSSAAGSAIQNNYWIFDQNTQQLGLYNYNTNSYKTIGTVFVKRIKAYYSTFNFFYWIDEDNNFYSCSYFGTISFLGKIPEYDTISLHDGNFMVYQKDEKLYLYDLAKNSSSSIENVQKTFRNFHYKNQNLAIFTNEGITNYKINLP